MKKTLTVNLGGTVFHIDEDAYRLLDNYLCNLKLHFRRQAPNKPVHSNKAIAGLRFFLIEIKFIS